MISFQAAGWAMISSGVQPRTDVALGLTYSVRVVPSAATSLRKIAAGSCSTSVR